MAIRGSTAYFNTSNSHPAAALRSHGESHYRVLKVLGNPIFVFFDRIFERSIFLVSIIQFYYVFTRSTIARGK